MTEDGQMGEDHYYPLKDLYTVAGLVNDQGWDVERGHSAFGKSRMSPFPHSKGCGSRMATLTMVFKLAQSAEQYWRLLNGSNLLEDVVRGIQFVDGLRKDAA